MKIIESKDPAKICNELRKIEKLKPSKAYIKMVESQLDSKFESVQSVAAQILSKWDAHISLETLFNWFTRLLEKKGSHAIRGVAAKSIASIVKPKKDTKWAVKCFLSLTSYNARFDFMPVMAVISGAKAKPLLMAAWEDATRDLKHSILVAASEMNQPESKSFFKRGLEDRDKYIRELSECFLDLRDSAEWSREQVERELKGR